MCDSMHPVDSCDSGAGLFLCKDRYRCLSSSLVCDGRRHCIDGSDEGAGCSEACGGTNATSASPTCQGSAKVNIFIQKVLLLAANKKYRETGFF